MPTTSRVWKASESGGGKQSTSSAMERNGLSRDHARLSEPEKYFARPGKFSARRPMERNRFLPRRLGQYGRYCGSGRIAGYRRLCANSATLCHAATPRRDRACAAGGARLDSWFDPRPTRHRLKRTESGRLAQGPGGRPGEFYAGDRTRCLLEWRRRTPRAVGMCPRGDKHCLLSGKPRCHQPSARP